MTDRKNRQSRKVSHGAGRQPGGTADADVAADTFPVVAVGASAGGLNAFRMFLERIPGDCRMAFILIQHLDPTHASMMADLLAGHTDLAVQEAADGMRIERGHIYTMPPGAYLSVRGDALQVSKPGGKQGVRLPFDFFLRSMAQAFGERAVCVVLSGAGTDGSVGLRAIKEHNGLVVAQEPSEAEHDGMPRSALATDAVDRVLPVGEIAGILVEYSHGRRAEAFKEKSPARGHTDADLTAVVDLLRDKTAHDFSQYKPGTLQRRIQRRMVLSGVSDNGQYLDLLKREPRELEFLAKDLLINVTNFFRDPAVFEFLAEQTIPELVRQNAPHQPIRIWVPGCSTGEEPYSIAMLVFEEIAKLGVRAKVQVFASDVDADAITTAREGLYPESIERDVSPARLTQFFTKEDHHYRVIPELRSAVIFAVQDVLADPPFARLDMISCRNLLIYLSPEAQDKVLRLFHFSLLDDGKLLLGSSETVGDPGNLFRPIDRTQRLYQRVGSLRPGEVDFPISRGRSAGLTAPSDTPGRPARGARLGEIARNALLEAHAPPSALINARHEVLYYVGQTDRYLQVVPGEPSRDLLLMARDGLRSKLRIALRQATQQTPRTPVRVEARMKREGAPVAVGITVQPVPDNGDTLFVVSFSDRPAKSRQATGEGRQGDEAGDTSPARLAEVERELEATRVELRSALQELELWSDDQRAINEEALSVNEEAQATNEELMTSKEELQSLNEELATLNNQLQMALDGQREAANDLQNILYSSDVATLFLDRDFNIRFFTPAAKSHFRIISSDIGRPLADLTPRIPDDTLFAEAHAVLERGAPTHSEIEDGGGGWYVRRIMPYRTDDGRIEGVVVTFIDISELKAAQQKIDAARAYSDSIVDNIRSPLLVLDDTAVVVSGNDAFYRSFAVAPEQVIGHPFAQVVRGHVPDPTDLLTFLEQVRSGTASVDEVVVEAELPTLGPRTLIVGAGLIKDDLDGSTRILLAIEDDTARRHAARALEDAKQQAEQANLAKSHFLAAASHDLRQPLQTLSLLQGLMGRKVREADVMKLVTLMDATLGAMSGMLNTLLDINQLEAGMVEPEVATFPVEDLLLRLQTEFGYHAAASGLGLRVARSGLCVRSDPRLLEQLIRNLLANAVKYTPRGKVLLGCRRHGDMLRIEVWDTGIGIPREQLDAIFQEFHQIGNPARERSLGLGLGLAIVRRLSSLLGHGVTVRSCVGRGSVFAVDVPLGRPEDVPPRSRSRRRHEAFSSGGGSGTVLIVEDDPDVRDTLALVFRNSGFVTCTAQDGIEAGELLAPGRPTPVLLVIDYDLPNGVNGLQVVEKLRGEARREIPAIILTGDITSKTSSAISRHGHTRLVKPVKLAELIGVTSELLQNRASPDASSPTRNSREDPRGPPPR